MFLPTSFHYTENNHLQFGMQVGAFDTSKSYFYTRIGECQRPPLSPIVEARKAARSIFSKTNLPLVLLMSGGVDSEAMAQAFLAERIPFTVAIGRYSIDFNWDDIKSVVDFCRKFEIDHYFIDIDLAHFYFSGKHIEYGARYKCRSPQLAVHLEMLSKINGCPVMGWNPCEIIYIPTFDVYSVSIPSEPHISYLRFLIENDKPGVPFFFAYTPELIYSFWNTSQFKHELESAEKFVSLKQRKTVQSYYGKVKKYREGGFNVTARSDKKTGFEYSKKFFREYYSEVGEIVEKYPEGLEPFDFKFRKPMEQMNPVEGKQMRIFSSKYFPQFENVNIFL